MSEIIIEFIAVSGSGKTYISELLVKFLAQEPLLNNTIIYSASDLWKAMGLTRSKILNKGIRIIERIRCLFSMPVLKLLISILFSGIGFMKSIRKIIYYLGIINLYRIMRRIKKLNRHCKPIFILDEGIFHASEIFISSASDKIPYDFLHKYEKTINSIKYIQYQDFVKIFIFVESATEVNFERLDKRSEGWPILLRHLSKKGRMKALDDFQVKVDSIKNYIADSRFLCFTINNSVDDTSSPDKFDRVFNTVRQAIIEEVIRQA
ncbi:MAG TPA: hypothetical protein GX505_09655 [Clostridiales bacterium]|nr:hypothetical protein [Clostridiales bacterium]